MDGVYLILVMIITGVEVANAEQVETLMNKLRRVEKVYSVARPMKLAGD